jgi:hypothetical protein
MEGGEREEEELRRRVELPSLLLPIHYQANTMFFSK